MSTYIKLKDFLKTDRILLFHLIQAYAVMGEASYSDSDPHWKKQEELRDAIIDKFNIDPDETIVDNEFEPLFLRGPDYNR